MNLPDLFTLWRFLLLIVVTIYSTIVIAQAAWGYWVYLSPRDRYTSLLRRYVALHTLRVRLHAFGLDLSVCAGLTIVLALLAALHYQAIHGNL